MLPTGPDGGQGRDPLETEPKPMSAPSKTQLLNDVHSHLKKRYKIDPREGRMSVLEAALYGICHEGSTREQASQALNRFKDQFFDWNEVRVSTVEEIKGVLAGLPDAEERANRLRKLLRQLFEKNYNFDLESLVKKPQKDALKALGDFDVFRDDYVLASVVLLALGGHAIPIDGPIRRALERLGAVEPGADVAAIRGSVERAIPKNRGPEFVDLMEELAHDTCLPGEPDCPRCELRKLCPTGRERIAAEKASQKAAARAASSKSKPVASTPLAEADAPAPKPSKSEASKGRKTR